MAQKSPRKPFLKPTLTEGGSLADVTLTSNIVVIIFGGGGGTSN
jgi:hypothetical protein